MPTARRLFFPVASALLRSAAFALLLTTATAQAQLFSDDAAREQAAKNAAEVADLKRALAQVNQNAEKALADAQAVRRQFAAAQTKIQELEARNRGLQGALDEAQHAANTAQSAATVAAETARQLLEELRAQSAALAAAQSEIAFLSETTRELESRAIQRDAQMAEQAELAASLARDIRELGQYADVPDEREIYESASALFQKRDYENALADFRRVLRYYPEGQFSEGARYWESAALYFLERHPEAIQAARALVAANPNSDKRPDAELILARALNAMGEGAEARGILEGIIEGDPASLAADKARQLLADIGDDFGGTSAGE